jgi:hypothetical protein
MNRRRSSAGAAGSIRLSDVDVVLTRFAVLDEKALAQPWPHLGQQTLDVRNALYWTLVEAQDALTRLGERRHSESRRILSLAGSAFGELRALLLGVPDELLDRSPGGGEWSLRQALRHIVEIERRYLLHTSYAVEREDADPIRLPDERLAAAAQVDAGGGMADLIGRIVEARADTDRRLGEVPPAAMTRPTVWVGYRVDVRFRLHRFAPHMAEHTIQCEKILAGLGWPMSEGRQIVRRAAAVLGQIESLDGASEARDLAQRLGDRMGPHPPSAVGSRG